MQPVPCWEKVWVIPDGAPVGSTFKVYKWVKTEKKQVRSERPLSGYAFLNNRGSAIQ
jgi:aminoglycoside phosphotransferase (APT) family kinase protein